LLYLLKSKAYDLEGLEKLLYKPAGLLGLSGISGDMRELLENKSPEAALAIEYFVYQIVKFIGSYATILGGLDAIVFTAGIGENAAPVRAAICAKLGWFGARLEEAAEIFQRNLDFAIEEEKEEFDLKPVWASPNEILYDLNTMQLRDFSGAAARGDTKIVATVIDAPYAGHHSTIADYAKGQSLVETLQSNGIRRVLCMDWKSATDQMKDYNIDIYLAEINAIVDDLGGQINLIGLCQGGWMAAMFAARYPHKVATLVTAGAPLDCDAGEGFVKKIAKEQPMSFFEDLVIQGGGLMRGKFMLAGWK